MRVLWPAKAAFWRRERLKAKGLTAFSPTFTAGPAATSPHERVAPPVISLLPFCFERAEIYAQPFEYKCFSTAKRTLEARFPCSPR